MKAVIFDFNGTMVFDSCYHDKAWKKFSKQIRGYEMSEEELARNVHGKVNEKIIEYLKPDVDKEVNLKMSLEKEALYRQLCHDDFENYKMVEGLEDFMDFLQEKKIPFTIASASIKENIDFFVETFQLSKWIEPSTIIYDDGTYKNKVKMFQDAAQRLHVNIEDCIVFEDSFSGIEYAKEAGVKKIVAIPSQGYKQEYDENEAIAFTIQNFKEEKLKEIFND